MWYWRLCCATKADATHSASAYPLFRLVVLKPSCTLSRHESSIVTSPILHTTSDLQQSASLLEVSIRSSNTTRQQPTSVNYQTTCLVLCAAHNTTNILSLRLSTAIIAITELMSVDIRACRASLRFPARDVTVSRAQLSSVHTGDLTRPLDRG